MVLSAGQAQASCVFESCFCAEDGVSKGSVVTTLVKSDGGTNDYLIQSSRGTTGLTQGELLSLPAFSSDSSGTSWLIFIRNNESWARLPISWTGTVSCLRSPTPVSLTVGRAQEFFERSDCYQQLAAAGFSQGECHDVRGCLGSQSLGGVMVGLSALWLRRQRSKMSP